MGRTVAYVMSRFPTVSETFILYEILELRRLGLRIEIFPLLRQNETVTHREAQPLVKQAHYPELGSVLSAQIYWLLRSPIAYFSCWKRAIWDNRHSKEFLGRAFYVVPVATLFAREIRKLNVEHVHAHWATHPTLAAYVIRNLTGVEYSFTAHAHDIYVERSMLREKIEKASFVVTISDYNKRLLERLYGVAVARKLHVIHCGVDPEIFRPRTTEKRGSRFTIVCVGSLKDYKGHRYLVEACGLLKKGGINFCCLLVGEGEERAAIEAQIEELRLQNNVYLLGWQSHDSVNEIMSKADAMALPSVKTETGKKEGIPVSLMEGLAMELPIVSTSISGIPELIQHGRTGLLVAERDANALADALLLLYRSPELRRKLGESGREKILQDFNLQTNTQRLYQLLEPGDLPIDFQSSVPATPHFENQGVTHVGR